MRMGTILPWSGVYLGLLLALAGGLAGCDSFDASPEEHLSKGVAYFQEGDLSAASIEFRNVLQEQPQNARARFYLGVTRLNTGEYELALKDLTKAKELGYSAQEIVLPLTQAHARAGSLEKALAVKAEEGMPPGEVARWHVVRGRAALSLGRRERAEGEFREALLADPGSAEARLGQAILAQAEGDWERASAWVDRVLAVEEAHAGAWRIRAMHALRDERREAALESLTRAIENSSPVRPADVFQRGLLRFKEGDLKGAREDAELLSEITGEEPRAPYLRGLIELRDGRLDAAQSAMEEALSRTDQFPAPRLVLAALHGEAGYHEQAQYQLNQYQAAKPDDPVVTLMRAVLAASRDRVERARELLEQYLSEQPGDRWALTLRARLAEEGGVGDGLFRETVLSGITAEGEEQVQAAGGEGGSGPQPREEVSYAGAEAHEAVVEAIGEGRYEQALTELDRLIAAHPEDPRLFNLRGGAYTALGQWERAFQAYQEALELEPAYISPMRNLGRLLARVDRRELALQVYRRGHERHPEHLGLALDLAGLEMASGQLRRAGEVLEAAIERHPKAPSPRVLEAQRQLRLGEAQAALDTLAPLSGVEGAERVELLRTKARAYEALGSPAQARAHWERLVERRPEDAGLRVELARSLVALEAYATAREQLHKAAQLAPDDPRPRVLEMRTYMREGDYERANALYAQLRSEELGIERELLSQGADLAMAQGDYATAIERLRRAQEVEPTEAGAVALARAHRRAERPERARAVLEAWSQERSGEPGPAAKRLLAELLDRAGEGEAAARLYRQLLLENPDDVVALNNLAWLIHDDRPRQAVAMSERALELAPGLTEARHTLALALRQAGETERAVQALEQVVAEAERERYVLDLAELYIEQRRWAEARDPLQRLLESGDLADPQRARRLLERARTASG